MERRSKLISVLMLCLAVFTPGTPAAADCNWECYTSPDEIECRQGAISFTSALECKVVNKCTLGGFIQYGDVWFPYYHCARECDMKWCVWV